MGDICSQLTHFFEQVKVQTEPAAMTRLSQQLSKVIHRSHLEAIFKHILKLPQYKLDNLEKDTGYMFLRKDTELAFTYFIGRDEEGKFQFILTPNGKTPDGVSGTATTQKSGSFKKGKLGYGFNLVTGSPTKMFRLTIKDLANETKNEKEFSQAVHSPFVTRYMVSKTYQKLTQVQQKDGKTTIVTTNKEALFAPFSERGDLHRVFSDATLKDLPTEQRWVISYCILAGLRHIHNTVHPKFNLRHRDFKLGNLLLENNGSVKIIDFGAWKKHDYETRTYQYSPPEFLEMDKRWRKLPDLSKSNYWETPAKSFWDSTPEADRNEWPLKLSGLKSDVWAAGQCLFEITVKKKLTSSSYQSFDPKDEYFLHPLLEADPRKRCTSDEALGLFLKRFCIIRTDAELTNWVNTMLSFYNNDFHRMQFLSELNASGSHRILNLIPEAQKTLLDYEKLLSWPFHLSISEWYRLRDLYQQKLTASEFINFKKLLYKRAEFTPDFLGSSLWHAMRTKDERVIKKLYKAQADVSRLFINIYQQRDYFKANECLEAGLCPWALGGDYTPGETKWFLERSKNAELIERFLIKNLSLKKLEKTITLMVDYGIDKHWKAVVEKLINTRTLKIKTLNALVKAGLPRELLAEHLLSQLKESDEDINHYFSAQIFDWICTSVKPRILDRNHLNKVALLALKLRRKTVFLNLKPSLNKLIRSFGSLPINESVIYLNTLFKYNVDLFKNIEYRCYSFLNQASLEQLNMRLLNKYLTAKTIPVDSLNVYHLTQICSSDPYWKRVINTLLEKNKLSTQAITALLKAGIPVYELFDLILSKQPERFSDLTTAGLPVMQYFQGMLSSCYTLEEMIKQLSILCEKFSPYSTDDFKNLTVLKIKCLNRVTSEINMLNKSVEYYSLPAFQIHSKNNSIAYLNDLFHRIWILDTTQQLECVLRSDSPWTNQVLVPLCHIHAQSNKFTRITLRRV
jgi:serine/threonine protein kinase